VSALCPSSENDPNSYDGGRFEPAKFARFIAGFLSCSVRRMITTPFYSSRHELDEFTKAKSPGNDLFGGRNYRLIWPGSADRTLLAA